MSIMLIGGAIAVFIIAYVLGFMTGHATGRVQAYEGDTLEGGAE